MADPTFPGIGIQPEQEQAFWRDGVLVLDQVLLPSEVATLREAGMRAEARWQLDTNRQGSDEPFLRRVEPLIEYDDEFVEMLDHPSFFPIVRELLGNGIAILDTAYFITPPGKGWGSTSEWHIDEALTGPHGSRIPLMVKVSIPLDDITSPEDGPTAVVLGSHRRSYDENLPSPDDPRDMPGKTPVIVRAGDVYIFHGRVHHAAMPNVGTRTRRMLQYNYGHIWMKPWPGHEPSERLQRTATSDLRKQVLHVSEHPYQARLA